VTLESRSLNGGESAGDGSGYRSVAYIGDTSPIVKFGEGTPLRYQFQKPNFVSSGSYGHKKKSLTISIFLGSCGER